MHSLSPDRQRISKADWDTMRPGMICENSGTFADMKVTIEQLCQISNACTFEVKQQLTQFFTRVQSVSGGPLTPNHSTPLPDIVKKIQAISYKMKHP